MYKFNFEPIRKYMKDEEIRRIIASALSRKKIIWNKHALERMIQRGISRSDVLLGLNKYEIIEIYSDDYPFPSFLLLGFSDKKPLHILIGIKKTKLKFM